MKKEKFAAKISSDLLRKLNLANIVTIGEYGDCTQIRIILTGVPKDEMVEEYEEICMSVDEVLKSPYALGIRGWNVEIVASLSPLRFSQIPS